MKRFLLISGLALVGSVAATNVAHAGRPSFPSHPGPISSSVPEIDPVAAGGIITLLAGATFLFDARRKRNQAADRS